MKSDSKVIETILLWLGIFSVIWFMVYLGVNDPKRKTSLYGECLRISLCQTTRVLSTRQDLLSRWKNDIVPLLGGSVV